MSKKAQTDAYGEGWYTGFLAAQKLSHNYYSEAEVKELAEQAKLEYKNDLDPECAHDWATYYTHLKCKKCSSVLTDGQWGIASRRVFKGLNEANFFKEHGRLPEDT